jgi:ADP-ribosylglycohydrolase
MLGAIAGDVIGSVFERHPIKSKEFPLFVPQSRFTDDTVLTVALADSLLHQKDWVTTLKAYYADYPDVGFGGAFITWTQGGSREPYGSWGNGSAMRVSPTAWVGQTLDEVLMLAARSAAVTHDHPEGIKGAQAIAAAVFMARTGATKQAIGQEIAMRFGYDLDRTIDGIRPAYRFDVSCQGSVPEAILAFLEAADFEDAIRNAVSLGGDADTMASMAGAIAEAFYGSVPEFIHRESVRRLDSHLGEVTAAFVQRYGVDTAAPADQSFGSFSGRPGRRPVP